jgi:hypothetical protein
MFWRLPFFSTLSRGYVRDPGFDAIYPVSTLARWFACTRLLVSHLTCLKDWPCPLTLTTTVFS